ncbi:MAG: ABC transporter ATP-binding protein [Candidatus Heimdallarchaeota archaeon]|nr:ABC transporter ATP-binding protein [Candidatus Heimdallarchaeota archaeon]
MPEVKLNNVVKTFDKGRIIAVDHVDLHVRNKEYLTLLGPSGCGKTTTLRMIAGLELPDEGEISIGEKHVSDLPPEYRDIGYVFQEYALFPHMDVWNNVTYGPRVKGWDEKKSNKIGREMLELVRLFERTDAFPSELSGGMKQRVALARALSSGSKLLLLDEPLGALDARIRTDLRYEIRKLVKDLQLTAIHVTHDQAEAMAISDRIAVMRKGKIMQVGTPQELYLNPQHIFVANFVGESNFLEGYVADRVGHKLTVELRGGIYVKSLNKDHKKGEKVVVAIRPEVLSISKGEKSGVNSIVGNIEGFRFEGNNVRYEIRLQNEDMIVVVRPALMAEWLSVGEKITVAFPFEKSFVFSYPEKGLRTELALE